MAVLGNIDEHVPHFIFGVEDSSGPDRDFRLVGLKLSCALDDVSLHQGIGHLARVGEILGHPLEAAGDPDFLSLVSVGYDFPYHADGAHFVVDLVGEIAQLAVPVPFAMDGYQHRYSIAEIGINYRPLDAGR